MQRAFLKEKNEVITVFEHSADVGSINDLIGIKNSEVKTIKKKSQHDVVNLYNHKLNNRSKRKCGR